MRVVRVEALRDEVSVGLVLGKDDRLSQAIAPSHRDSARHQMLQHLVHGVLVEQPFVDRRSVHLTWDRAVFVPIECIPLVLLVLGEVVILDALALKLEWHRHCPWRHEVPVLHCFVKRISIGRDTVFQVEEAVGIAIHVLLGGRRQAYQERIEVIEDRAVLLENGPVGFINDDEVEVPYAEPTLAAPSLID